MKKTTTACCALAQLSGLSNTTTLGEICSEVIQLKKGAEEEFIPGDGSGNGQRCYFVITTPDEILLRVNLKKAGFKKIHTFKRRNGYPKGKLKMYAINI